MFTNLITAGIQSGMNLWSGEINIFDILDSLIGLLGPFGQTVCALGLVIGILGCFFGFRLTKFFMGFCGFCIGGLIGIFMALKHSSPGYLFLGFIFAIVLAALSYKLYKLGVFIISFLNSSSFFFVIFLIFFKELSPALTTACAIGVIAGIVSIIFEKPTIIISTAVSFGNMSGIFLAALMTNTSKAGLLSFIFIAVGLLIQIKTNDGLLEGAAKKVADNIIENIKDEIKNR